MLYTTIVYRILREAGLSVLEYVVMDIVNALSNNDKYPYCTLQAEKIADMLNVNPRTITRIYSRLEDMEYIQKRSKTQRRSTPKWRELIAQLHTDEGNLAEFQLPKQDKKSAKTSDIEQTKCPEEQDKMSEEQDKMSVLYNNNIYNNNITLPKELGKTPSIRLLSLYNRLLFHNVRVRATLSIPACVKIFNTLLKTEHEVVVGILLLAYFTYQPTDRGGQWLADTAKSSAYPLGLFLKNVNQLKSYLVNVKGVDLDDIDKLNDILHKYMEGLTSN